MTEDLVAAIKAEKEELLRERENYLADQRRTAELIETVDTELKAIEAYEQTRTGKPPAANGANGKQTDRHRRRVGVRTTVLEVVAAAGSGLTRGEILAAMGLHGDKSGEMSVSNALTNLMKTHRVVREAGRYQAARGY
jgi:hypothetical protein